MQRTLYGRRQGRSLRKGQKTLIQELLPSLEIFLPAQNSTFNPTYLFAPTVKEIWLEIGFGAGEHIIQQALKHPSVGIIGCEPYINGVARLLRSVSENELNNLRVFRDDARLLLNSLTNKSIARTFILFPDPWPKARHYKRRMIGPSTVPLLYRKMAKGSELRIATDDKSYKEWILWHMLFSNKFDWCAQRASDWKIRPQDWPETRYEKKAVKEGRQCSYFLFKRRN